MKAGLAARLRDSTGTIAAVQALFAGRRGRATSVPELTALRAWADSAPVSPKLANPASALPDLREPTRRSADAAADDWDALFAAVADRLSQGVAGPLTAGADLRSVVTECLQALSFLRGMRAQERGDERAFEQELRHASDALAAAHGELVQVRLGERRDSHLAQHDSLTSLPNRDRFSARRDHDLLSGEQRAPSLAVLFLDLDGFKPINDHHGHDTGDELLRIIASRLSSSVRKQDMVCRLGGDEFACVLSEPRGREQLSQIAAKLFDAVSAPLTVGALKLRVRPSIGIAMCPDDGDTATKLLEHADSALYRAKCGQLGFAFFDRSADL